MTEKKVRAYVKTNREVLPAEMQYIKLYNSVIGLSSMTNRKANIYAIKNHDSNLKRMNRDVQRTST